MKKVLLVNIFLICIGNLSAQVLGDYQAVASGNWDAIATWQRHNGTSFVAATDYPGASTPIGAVTIQNGLAVTLNVSPANDIGSLLIEGGNTGTGTSLNISGGFVLNVTGEVQIGPPTANGNIQAIIMNGPAARLNCGTLTLIQGGNNNRLTHLQFANGGFVEVIGDVVLSILQPQRTLIDFIAGNGTLEVFGNFIGGQMNINSPGTTTINVDPMTLGNLVMNNAAATLDLNGITTVTGTLTLTAGKIDFGVNLLTLANTTPAAQLVGGNSSSYVYTTSPGARFIRTGLAAGASYTFPVGTPTDYLPVTVNTAAGTSSFAVNVFSPATINATVGGPQFPDKSRLVDAMWYIDRPTGTGNSTLTLQWVAGLEGATFTGLPNTQIGISRHNGISWSSPPIQTSGDNITNSVTATFNTFSPFAIADIGTALPVKFGSIKAYEKLNGIQLDWKVYSENKVKTYEIERSADGRSYTTVGSLPALYNNKAEGDYGFFDANPLPGTSYYRIKNNDLDGKSAYSIVIRVNRNKAIMGLSLYPNPVLNRIVSLQGSDLGRGNYKISIFGANGQEIYKHLIKHNGGTISQTIELPSTISKGVYMFSVRDESGNIIFNEKLVNQ